MEVFSEADGSTGPMKMGPLMGFDYDPVGKGDDIILSIGVDDVDHTHTIGGPVEIWRAQLDSGEIGAVEIIDQSKTKTVISLGES